MLVQHTAALQKLLKTRADRHNLMAGGHAAPSLDDADPNLARIIPGAAQQAEYPRPHPLRRKAHILQAVEDV